MAVRRLPNPFVRQSQDESKIQTTAQTRPTQGLLESCVELVDDWRRSPAQAQPAVAVAEAEEAEPVAEQGHEDARLRLVVLQLLAHTALERATPLP